MDMNSIIVSICSVVIVAAVTAFMISPQKIVDKIEKRKISIQRVRREEDDFYRKVKTCRALFVTFFESIPTLSRVRPGDIDCMSLEMLELKNAVNNSPVILGKYKEFVDAIIKSYSRFNVLLRKYMSGVHTEEETIACEKNFKSLKKSIIKAFSGIDALYFNKVPVAKSAKKK